MSTFTAKEIASACNAEPKAFRAFVRAQAASDAPIVPTVGSGHRYAFSDDEAKRLISAYDVYKSTKGRQAHAQRSAADVLAMLDLVDEISKDEG